MLGPMAGQTQCAQINPPNSFKEVGEPVCDVGNRVQFLCALWDLS